MRKNFIDILAERLKRESEVRLTALREVREMAENRMYGYASEDLYNDGYDSALAGMVDAIDALIKREEEAK